VLPPPLHQETVTGVTGKVSFLSGDGMKEKEEGGREEK
jgi:hypothetical protein